jgi:hypothetical protein
VSRGAAAAARDLRPRVPAWIDDTRAQAADDVAGTVEALQGAAQRLAELVAYRSTASEMVALDVVQRAANTYLAEAGEELDILSQRLAAGLAERLRDLTAAAAMAGDAEGQAIVDAMFTWDRAVRAYTTFVQQYLAGVVQGGGLALGLYLELGPEQYDDVQVVAEVVHRRLSFLPDRIESAIDVWIDEVHTGLVDILGVLADQPEDDADLDTVRSGTFLPDADFEDTRTEVMPLKAIDEATRAARQRVAVDPNQERLKELLAFARSNRINVRKVPDKPSERYLDKLEAQLDAVVAKREAARAAARSRKERLDELLGFAKRLRVKVKKIPDNPSNAWLDKMEAKLAQVAARKGVQLPDTFEPPTQQEQAHTPDLPPARRERERDRKAEEARRARAAAMVARAEEAGLELGRVPTVPTDDWIAETEARLDDALEQEKARSKQKRQRADHTRRERVERLKSRASMAGIDLGPVPPLPTTHWLERTEARVNEALGEAPTEADGLAMLDPALAARLEDIETRSALHGLSLGAVPPVPDEAWLRWAEERIEEAELAEQPLAVSADSDVDQQAYLIYEEGTVQERIWVVEDDEMSIGRSRGNVVQIRDDSSVSRRHCTLRRGSGSYFLRDEGSTKGTLVDGSEISEVMLQGGERITIGETNFVFRLR